MVGQLVASTYKGQLVASTYKGQLVASTYKDIFTIVSLVAWNI
jgi:hypothetical protein